jgi:hypothetical protein
VNTYASVYVFLHNLLNVLVQIANIMGFKKKLLKRNATINFKSVTSQVPCLVRDSVLPG